jgi:hypothetical protein
MRTWSCRGVLCTALLSASLWAQPHAAYMLPDIGAPGMAVYVEIVAHVDSLGAFGADGLYLNRPGDPVQLECANPADTAKLTLGPLVVSWNGRLISTLVFVAPWVRPNSWRWNELAPEFRIPLRLRVGNSAAVVDTFYIVQPTPIGAYGGSERVLGQGALGIRSRRGAMVIDSFIVAAGTEFRVSTADCDPFTPGNQGYLPFVLLSQGPIRGARIRVDAEGIHGGPGGGGGGGAFCDVAFGSANGTDGGNGFTSGGRGGKNGIGVGPNEYRNYGQSTGPNGASLNGVLPGSSPMYESAGGGTGHPFGRSGEGCRDGNTCDPVGGYGGGSGHQQRLPGGGGGYATRGESASGRSNGGQEHGNSCLVPLAGGSGGGSGNPQGVNVCSGSGGGGGGAIAIVAPMLSTVELSATGAPGAIAGSSAGSGGSGSGGAVLVCASEGYEQLSLNVSGGRASGSPSGGAGRVRLDGPERTPYTALPPEATRYRGPSLWAPAELPRTNAPLRGTGNGQELLLLQRSPSQPWTVVDTLRGYGTQWSRTHSFPAPDTLFLLAVLQRIPGASASPYAAEPEWLLSAAAARIVRIARFPTLQAPNRRTLDTVLCASEERLDTVQLRNLGDAPLQVRAILFRRGTAGFRVLSPAPSSLPLWVAPGDSLPVIVAFRAPAPAGLFSDTLTIVHTDTTTAGSPWRIAYEVWKDSLRVTLLDGSGTPLDTLELGTLCPGEEQTWGVDAYNPTARPITVRLRSTAAAYFTVAPGTPLQIPPGQHRPITVIARSGGVGQLEGALIAELLECPVSADTVWLRALGLRTTLTLQGSGQFGQVRVGTRAYLTVSVHNRGPSAAWIRALPPVAAPFQLESVQPQLPVLLLPQQELRLRFSYAPVAAQTDAIELRIVAERADSGCPDTVRLLLSGTGVRAELQLSRSTLDFGQLSRCDRRTDTVLLFNTGDVPLGLPRAASIVGPDADAFMLIVQPRVPTQLRPGDTAIYIVQSSPGAELGMKTAQLVIPVEDSLVQQLVVELRVERVLPFIAIPAAVQLGTLTLGEVRTVQLTGRNLLLRPQRVSAVVSSHPDITVSPQQVTVAPAATQEFELTVAARRLGPLYARLQFVLEEPCRDTSLVELFANVIGEEIAYTNALSFGTVALCEERWDTLRISNRSADTLWLEGIALAGLDAAVFTVLTPALPAQIAPGETLSLPVRFAPQQTPDGEKSARVELQVRLGTRSLELQVLLSGRRRTPLLSAPEQLRFGTLPQGQRAQQLVTISNAGELPIRVDSLRLRRGAEFSISQAPALPRSLAQGEQLVLTVAFQPLSPGSFADTLVLFVGAPCPEERQLILEGSGAAPARIRVWLPDTQATPWARGFRIPLYLAAEGIASWHAATAEIRYDPTLFLLRGVARGRLLRQERQGETAIALLQLDSLTAGRAVIAELVGDVLLGAREATPLQLSSFLWDDGFLSSQTERADGQLRLVGLCTEGGPRLLQPAGSAAINVSQQDGALRIETSGSERGAYRVELYTVQGRRIAAWEWEEHTAAPHRRSWSIPAPPAGVYGIRLWTPSEAFTHIVLVW